MSLLDTVDPDAWMHDQRKDAVPNAAKQLWLKVRAKQVEHYTKPLYSRETVESLLAENTKQVLMEVRSHATQLITRNDIIERIDAILYEEELRRMASEPIGNDLGEKG